MHPVNFRSVFIGALAGCAVWTGWSALINAVILSEHFVTAQSINALRLEPRLPYPVFLAGWIAILFVLSFIITYLYAIIRPALGSGAIVALRAGVLVGFAAAVPVNFVLFTWSSMGREISFFWALDLGVGAIFACLIGGFLYRD